MAIIQARTTWNGEQAKGLVLDATWVGLQRATVFFWNTLMTVLNVSNPLERRKEKIGKKTYTYSVYTNSSRPGEPPRARTGHLKGHVIYELDRQQLKSRVGLLPGAKYGAYLEFGTIGTQTIRPRKGRALFIATKEGLFFRRSAQRKPLLPRPWLFVTLKKILPQLAVLAGSGGGGPSAPTTTS